MSETGTSYRTANAEALARAWVESVASRTTPRMRPTRVQTRFGMTHLLRSDEGGAGEVVCLPGWGTSCAFWGVADQLAPLAEVGRVSVIDVPGQPGLSDGRPISFESSALGSWLADVLDGLGVEKADLVGASMGGLMALRASRHLGGRIRRVALLAPAGFVLPLPRPGVLATIVRYWMRASPERAGAFIRACLLGGVQELAEEAQAELAAALSRSAASSVAPGLPPLLLGGGELRAVRHPLLLVVGENDPVFSARRTLARARRHRVSSLESVVLPAHGHALELSRVALALTADFLGA